MLPDKDQKCHLTGFEKSCRDLVCSGACGRWKLLEGRDGDKPFANWDCIDNHAHLLQKIMVFSIQSNSAAIESMRNETKKAHDEGLSMAAIAVHRSSEAIRDVFSSSPLAVPPSYAPINLLEAPEEHHGGKI